MCKICSASLSGKLFTYYLLSLLILIPIICFMVCVLKPVLFCTYSYNEAGGSSAVSLGASRWSQINSFFMLQHYRHGTAVSLTAKNTVEETCGRTYVHFTLCQMPYELGGKEGGLNDSSDT